MFFFFLCSSFSLLHFWNSGVRAVFVSVHFYLFIFFVMKTYTHTISQDAPALTGEAHVQQISLSKSLQEITLNTV